jgi:hypothetical protein
MDAGPALGLVVGHAVGLVGPAEQHAPPLRRVVERLGRVEVAVVVAEPALVAGGVVRHVPVLALVVAADGVVVVPGEVQAVLEHVLGAGLGGVEAVLLPGPGHREEVRALPHPRQRRVQRVLGAGPPPEVPAPVHERQPAGAAHAADEHPPVPVGVPRRRRVAELRRVDAALRHGDRVQLRRLHPLPKQRVRLVLGEGDVLHLVVDVRAADPRVGDRRRAVGEERRRAGPAAVLVGRDAGVDGGLQRDPVDEVARHRVRPHDVAPHRALGVVLVEQVVPPLVVHRSCSSKIPKHVS